MESQAHRPPEAGNASKEETPASETSKQGESDESKSRKTDFRSAFQEARTLVWAHRKRLALGMILILIDRLAGLVLPYTSKPLFDDVLLGGEPELLPILVGAAAAATLVQAGSSFALTMLLSVSAQRAITDMRMRVEQHLLRLPVSYFDNTKSGALISRVMTDAEGIRNLVGTGLVQLVGGLLTAALALSYLFYLNWRLTTVTLVVLLVFAGLVAWAFSYLRPIFRERGELNAEVSGRLAESMGGVRIVKAYTAEKRESLTFARGVHALLRNVVRTLVGTAGVGASSSVLLGGVGLLMMVLGTRAISAGTMTVGDFVSYIFFTGLVVVPLVEISAISTQLSEAFAGLDRIREVLSEDPEQAEGEALTEVRGEVRFDDVGFAYKPGQPVLHDVSFTAAAGSTTALVGSSGSGKSTLTSLVAAFNQPQQGRIFIDGRDLNDLRLADYRRHLGIVLQDNFLFDGTIAENIRYGARGSDDNALREAARLAYCDPFVDELDEGYDTVVGERGVKLSGGQRQRIAIARAILADPSVLILDEATSSLDSESEAMIQAGLQALRQGRTTFVIAHRLSTIRSADQILVLEEGKIVERGTHDELMQLNGRYRELHDRQHRFEQNRFVNPGEDFSPEPVGREELLSAGKEKAKGTKPQL